jgi:hypothetical protein
MSFGGGASALLMFCETAMFALPSDICFLGSYSKRSSPPKASRAAKSELRTTAARISRPENHDAVF